MRSLPRFLTMVFPLAGMLLAVAACQEPPEPQIRLSDEDRLLLRSFADKNTAGTEARQNENQATATVDGKGSFDISERLEDNIWLFTDQQTGCQYWYVRFGKNDNIQERIGNNGRHHGCKYDDEAEEAAEFTN